MNRRQKTMLVEVATVLVITLIAVVGMINFKDYVNRSEAMNAMQEIGKLVLEYQEQTGRVPAESLVRGEMDRIRGAVRLGLQYRGLWIDFETEPNDILAYAKKRYPASLLDDGYIVLQLDGTVAWMETEEFEALLAEQQGEVEIEMTQP